MDRAREVVALVGVGLAGLGLVVLVVVVDLQFVATVYERSEAATLAMVVAAVAAALGTVLAVIWSRRRWDGLGSGVRRLLGRLAIAWSVLFVAAFIWTHPRGRDAELALPLHAGVVTYVLAIVVSAVAFLPVAFLQLGRRRA